MHKTFITWDLGATKCKAGIIEYLPQSDHYRCLREHTVKLADAHSLPDLIRQLEAGLGMSMGDADAICIGAAGTFDGQTIYHTNPYPFPMTISEAAAQFNWPAYAVIHDYASIVCATFTSLLQTPEAARYLTKSKPQPYSRRVAFGIGTGLGLKDGILFPDGRIWLGHNEIGHIGIPTPPQADTDTLTRHQEIALFLRRIGVHSVTFEEILSGRGTAHLHQFFYPHLAAATPEETGIRMRSGQTPELMDALAWYLGLLVGTIQLTFMPAGGIYMTGGVALHHLDLFDHPALFKGIESMPAYLKQRAEFPLAILNSPEAALIGCGFYANCVLLQPEMNHILLQTG